MKKVLSIFLIFAFLFSIFAIEGCGKKQNDIIKIGAILPLTGPASDIGEWQRRGIMTAERELKDIGEFNGKKLKIIYEDSKGQPKEGISAFNKLVEIEKAQVIFCSLSSVSNAVLPLTVKAEIPTMLIAVSYPGITKKSEWVFRDHPGSDDEALAMAYFMYHYSKIKNIAVLYCNDDFGIGGYEALKKSFEGYGGKIIWAEAYELNQTDFRSIITKLRGFDDIEGIYVIGYVKASVILIKQLREMGYKKFLAAPMALSIPTFVQLAGGALEQAYFTSTKFDSKSDDMITKRFSEKFRSLFDSEPNVFSALSYDGVMMIAEVLKSKANNKNEIKKGLLELHDFPGVMGNLSVTEDRNIKFPLRIVKLENGEFTNAE